MRIPEVMADVRQVFTHLLTASRHHLAAFEAAAAGDTLAPGEGWRGMGPGMGYGMGPGTGMMRGGPDGSRGSGDCPMWGTTAS